MTHDYLPTCEPPLEPRDPEYAAKVRHSFERQDFMAHLGARLVRVDPGWSRSICRIARC